MFLILNVRTSLQPDLLAAEADDYSVTKSLEDTAEKAQRSLLRGGTAIRTT